MPVALLRWTHRQFLAATAAAAAALTVPSTAAANGGLPVPPVLFLEYRPVAFRIALLVAVAVAVWALLRLRAMARSREAPPMDNAERHPGSGEVDR